MGAKATAPVAEVTAVLIDLIIRDDRRLGLVPGGSGSDVYKINELAIPGANTRGTAAAGLVDQDNKITRRVLRLRGQRGHWMPKQREDFIRAHSSRSDTPPQLRAP